MTEMRASPTDLTSQRQAPRALAMGPGHPGAHPLSSNICIRTCSCTCPSTCACTCIRCSAAAGGVGVDSGVALAGGQCTTESPPPSYPPPPGTSTPPCPPHLPQTPHALTRSLGARRTPATPSVARLRCALAQMVHGAEQFTAWCGLGETSGNTDTVACVKYARDPFVFLKRSF